MANRVSLEGRLHAALAEYRHGKVPVGLLFMDCLLYTSDAADERSSVDLGGRRIIKKKKNVQPGVDTDRTRHDT